MTLNITLVPEIEEVITIYFKKFGEYVPDTPLRKEDSQYIKNLIASISSMLKRRFKNLELSDVEDIMKRGIEGEFDTTLRLLTLPKIFKWFQVYSEKERRRQAIENEQTHYIHKTGERDPNWKQPATSRGAACTFVLKARVGNIDNWLKVNNLKDLNDSDIDFVMDNLDDCEIKDWFSEQVLL